MNINNISIRDVDHRWESLSLSLQAIARWAGVELPFRSINAALGLSFMISAPTDERESLSWWMTYGRDAFLIETGKLFGLGIRRLEIPSTEPGSEQAFKNFTQQVQPQIAQHISNDQPVIIWQGWSDYHSKLWGVLTQEDASSELGFSGTTMWAHGRVQPLTSPPVRAYVVEDIQPRQPQTDQLLRFAISNIQKVVHNKLDPQWGVVTGLPAYSRWLQWLSQTPQAESNGTPEANNHYQMACFVTFNRESAIRFIEHYKDGLHEEMHPYLEALLANCRGVISSLATSRDLKAVEVLYRSADGRRALAAGVDAAHDFLKAQIEAIDHLVDQLGV